MEIGAKIVVSFSEPHEGTMGENVKIMLAITEILAVLSVLSGCATVGTVRVEGESGRLPFIKAKGIIGMLPPLSLRDICLPLASAAFGILTVRRDNNHPQAIAESLNIGFHQEHGLFGVNSDSVCLSRMQRQFNKTFGVNF